MHIYIYIYIYIYKYLIKNDHITCRKYLWKQSEEYCCTWDGTTTFPYLWCLFKNCGIPKYPSQLLKLSPKSHFLFSEFLCKGEGGRSVIIYWNKINSFSHKNLYNRSYKLIDMSPGKVCDIRYSTFLEG